MIVRVFRARLKPGMRAAYERFCSEKGIPVLRAAPGCLAVHLSGATPRHPDEGIIVSVWRDLASLRAFAGPHWNEGLILPGEADLLDEVAVQHFDESNKALIAIWHAMADTVRARETRITTTPLSDAQWDRVRPLLPPAARTGRPRADDRRTLDGILYVLRTGCRWHDLPPSYGSAVTCWRRLAQWEADGTWERIWRALFEQLDLYGRHAWARAVLNSQLVPIPAKRTRHAKHGARRAG